MTGLGLTPDSAIPGIKKEIIISPTVVHFALTAAFLICSKVSLCKQHTYMDTLTLLQVDTPYNLIDNYMDGQFNIETSTTNVESISIDPGFLEK